MNAFTGRPSKPFALAQRRSRNLKEKVIEGLLLACAITSILTTIAFILIFFSKTFDFFKVVSFGEFFGSTRWAPLSGRPSYGIWPLITGTLLVTGIAMVVALPLGLLSAIYLSEFASERVRRVVKPVLEVLAGIPTVVYGYFALLFLTPLLRLFLPEIHFWNALSAGLVMGVMILPMVSSISEDAMHAVPQSLREGAYAVGATKFEVAAKIIVPAALSGVAAAFILAVSRAIGETMIVAIAAGQTPNFPGEPLAAIGAKLSAFFNGIASLFGGGQAVGFPNLSSELGEIANFPLEPNMTLTAYIVNVATGDHPAGAQIWDSLFTVGTVLFLMTLFLNILSYYIVKRFREQYE